MLQPKRTKFRKAHKGRIHGVAKGWTSLNFGSVGLKAMEPERVTARQIEAARRSISRYVLHAAAPIEAAVDDALSWIDLDLDFQMHGDEVALVDEDGEAIHLVTHLARAGWSRARVQAPQNGSVTLAMMPTSPEPSR